jgi:hypothetical protein
VRRRAVHNPFQAPLRSTLEITCFGGNGGGRLEGRQPPAWRYVSPDRRYALPILIALFSNRYKYFKKILKNNPV